MLAGVAVLIAAALGGCASPRAEQGRFVIEAGGYETAFDTTRRTLVDMGYTLDRVDARAGVLTTQSRPASLIHPDRVSVRVEFWPRSQFGRQPSDRSRSQIEAGPALDHPAGASLTGSALIAEVTALRERIYRPRFRPQVADALRSGRVQDPALEEQIGSREVVVPISREPDIEDRIAGRIEDRLTRP